MLDFTSLFQELNKQKDLIKQLVEQNQRLTEENLSLKNRHDVALNGNYLVINRNVSLSL